MSSAPMKNIHVSTHPCVKAKLSKLRSSSTTSRETRLLVNEIASLIAAEALGDTLTVEAVGEVWLRTRQFAWFSARMFTGRRLTKMDIMVRIGYNPAGCQLYR